MIKFFQKYKLRKQILSSNQTNVSADEYKMYPISVRHCTIGDTDVSVDCVKRFGKCRYCANFVTNGQLIQGRGRFFARPIYNHLDKCYRAQKQK